MTTRPEFRQALPAIERYAMTVLAVACTLTLRMIFNPFLGSRAPFMLFLLTVVLAKRLWGRGPALLATLLGGLSAWYFIIEPEFSFHIADPPDALNLAAYLAIGVSLSYLGEKSGSAGQAAGRGRDILKVRLVRQMAVLAGAAVVLAGMVILLLRDFRRTQEAEGWVVHTYQVIDAAGQVRTFLENAAGGQRGFLLTGDERFLASYHDARGKLARAMEELTHLTRDNPAQQSRLKQLQGLIDARLALLEQNLDTRRTAGFDAAATAVLAHQGERYMDEIRSSLDAVLATEQGLLAERSARAKAQALWGRWVLGLGSGAIVLLLALTTFVIERDAARREGLAHALRRHADLLEQSHDSLLTCVLGGGITYWSAGAQALFGYTREEALGRSSHELLQTHHPEGIALIDARLQREGHWEGELTQVAKDGHPISVGARWVLASDPGGTKIVLEAHRDITARKRAEERLRQNEAILRSFFDSPGMMRGMVEQVNGQIVHVFCNEAAAQLYGIPREAIAGRTAAEAGASEDVVREWLELYARARDTGRPVTCEYARRDAQGRDRWLLATASYLGAGPLGNPRFAYTIYDLSDRKRTEAERFLLSTAIEQAVETVVVTDREARIQYVNPAFTRTTGYTRSEAQGQNPRILKSGRHDAGFYQEMWATLAAGRIWHGEFTNRAKNGTLFLEEATIAPVRNEAGETTNYIAIKSDITERKRAERALAESELRYRELFERSESALAIYEMVYDAQGNTCDFRYLHLNRAFERITGRVAGQTLGRTAREVTPNIEDYWIQLFGQVAKTGEPTAFEHYAAHLGRYYAGIAYTPRPNQVAVSFTDYTERKRAEDEIRQLNLELEKRVRQRTTALETANRELEAFAYSVSHDLRAPLRGIDGWSQALLEDYGKSLDEKGRKYLDRVRSEAQRMGVLIDDLLHLSRVTRIELVSASVDLTALAQSIAGRLKEANPGRALEFIIAPGLVSTGDPRLLAVALTNLFDNAVKFTGPREVARVEFGRTSNGSTPAFFVRDNGVGFDMAYSQMLFAPFQRLHKVSEFPGTGVGLATVQRVIHRHGGRIWGESALGSGTTFYFTLDESRD